MKLFNGFIVITFLLTTIACASNRSVETTETRSGYSDGSEEIKVTREETVSESNSKSCSGVLSCTVDFLGDVIAFPFRLVGGIVEAIF